MENKFIVIIILVGLFLFYFIFDHLKKRVISDQSSSGFISPANISWEEKREHPRVEISWKARLEKAEEHEEVLLKNISLGGAFVVCENPLALQDKLTISIDLPGEGFVQLNAEVVWSNAQMPRDKVVNRGMGIKFINNEENIRQQLRNAITAAVGNSGQPKG